MEWMLKMDGMFKPSAILVCRGRHQRLKTFCLMFITRWRFADVCIPVAE